jgi:hypothetical protein
MSKQLLIEHSLFQPIPSLMKEGKGTGNLIVAGKVQAADKPNANRRVYGYDILKEQVDKYIAGPITERRATGELDHPETAVINLKNVCHNITKLWWQGTDLYGEFEILNTPSGNILKELFRAGINVGVSSRALGSTTQLGEGLVSVDDDLELICWDFVSNPSTFGAFVKPTGMGGLNESVNYESVDKYAAVNIAIRETLCLQTGICCIK